MAPYLLLWCQVVTSPDFQIQRLLALNPWSGYVVPSGTLHTPLVDIKDKNLV